jgi:hypothetical protein
MGSAFQPFFRPLLDDSDSFGPSQQYPPPDTKTRTKNLLAQTILMSKCSKCDRIFPATYREVFDENCRSY